MNSKVLWLLIGGLSLSTSVAHGFGSKPAEPTPTPPATQQAKPIRYLNLTHITAPAFYFPNGQRADFNLELDQLVDTGINASNYFRTQSTDRHARLIMTGGITALEMDALQLNLKFGWNQNGALPVTNPVNGSMEVDLRLSNLEMDFKIYDRYTGQTYTSTMTDETLSNIRVSVRVNLTELQSALDLLYKTGMSDAIRKAMASIMTNFEKSAAFNTLPWEARVVGKSPDGLVISFNAGTLAGVKVNDIYQVYSNCSLELGQPLDGCFEQHLADVKVTKVGQDNSEAVAFTASDSVSRVLAKDKVFVKVLSTTRK